MSKYFAIVPLDFQVDNFHNARQYFTGRSGYKGGLITFSQKPKCDPLGAIYAAFTGKKDTLIIELICKPVHQTKAFFRVTKTKPEGLDAYQLKSSPLESTSRLTVYTDFGEQKQSFVEKIDKFLGEHPNSIEMIELSDMNSYDTRQESQFVARFDISVDSSDKSLLEGDLIDFIMDVSDEYVMLKLSKEQAQKNDKIREKIASKQRKEEYERSKEEKKPEKLTLEQQIARDKKDKKGKRKDSPRIKTVKG